MNLLFQESVEGYCTKPISLRLKKGVLKIFNLETAKLWHPHGVRANLRLLVVPTGFEEMCCLFVDQSARIHNTVHLRKAWNQPSYYWDIGKLIKYARKLTQKNGAARNTWILSKQKFKNILL